MATLDEIQARLSAEISRAMEARMRAPQTRPGPDAESAATLAAEIEARLMQCAEPAEPDDPPSTPTACPTFTRPLQDDKAMPTLTDEIKTFIVKGLACYDTPSQVAEAVKAIFGLEVSWQQVYVYDPGCSQPPAQRWRDLYAATRQALLRELGEIGIAHRAVRLRRLDRMACRAERNNVRTALKCLEMAAKECGGMYENRKPIVSQPTLPQSVMPEPPAPQHAAIRTAMPQPAAIQPAPPQPPAAPPQPPAKRPARPQPAAARAAAPQPPAPLPAAPSPVMPQPDRPATAAPQPPAVLVRTPQGPALPESPPLNRVDRYLAYVRDRHARDRQVREAAAAQAALENSGRISPMPPAS